MFRVIENINMKIINIRESILFINACLRNRQKMQLILKLKKVNLKINKKAKYFVIALLI